ncbi:phytoene/squalene synthase family protein [Actinosynnema sp. NPDC047251]|uniref:Squalene/phytoene synthase n=1 Tax=Saccharothrix espanaensis (strain ATCC 51144 / DSM 44229 / JCM 9112 / NBRC 15066 / NRRL 15764) TaxID=1179773 RepID=K0K1X9_SACES|nr:phytoene/squalene synthase family protein [Saccharothrix espanaensis]CCH32351.1 Squalene/phytoene synthase [Saccharothrix espanaensis DSM 44229]
MSADRELDAAKITDPAMRAAYRRCRALNAEHGRTFYLATRLLPPDRRPAVHALYGFARWVDDIVDEVDDGRTAAQRAAELTAVEGLLEQGLRTGASDNPVISALLDTSGRYGIPRAHFEDFMSSMRMDLTVTDYPTWDDLARYVHGSAAVIGLQVLPVLGTTVPRAEAEPAAADLGVAFQLTNFLRDVGEDLDRGRVYLPADELAASGVDRDLLVWSRRTGRADQRVRDALAAQVARARRAYRAAEPGLRVLDPRSRPCVATAFRLYGRILDLVERADYDVLSRRVAVSQGRRLVVALPALARAAFAH